MNHNSKIICLNKDFSTFEIRRGEMANHEMYIRPIPVTFDVKTWTDPKLDHQTITEKRICYFKQTVHINMPLSDKVNRLIQIEFLMQEKMDRDNIHITLEKEHPLLLAYLAHLSESKLVNV